MKLLSSSKQSVILNGALHLIGVRVWCVCVCVLLKIPQLEIGI